MEHLLILFFQQGQNQSGMGGQDGRDEKDKKVSLLDSLAHVFVVAS